MKYFLFTAMLLFSSFVVSAQKGQAQKKPVQNAPAKKTQQMKAYLDHKVFYEPSVGNYAEVHLQFMGYSLKYKGIPGGLQGEVAIQLVFKSGDVIAASDAYKLESPIMRDSVVEDFYDLKRFALKPGVYELEVSLQDLNSDAPAMTGKQTIEIKDFGSKPAISDVQVSEVMKPTTVEGTFSKSGYEMIPRISNYYTTEANTLPVYFELYQPGEKETVGVKQMILKTGTGEELEAYTRFSRHDVDKVQPIVRVIDITKLSTGEYTLVYTLISKNNEELAKTSYFFERANDVLQDVTAENIVLDPAFQASITDDSVFFYMESLIPISRQGEVRNILSILKKKDIEQMRKYIQAYWVVSSTTEKPYESWMRYKQQVQLVQRLYSNNFMSGFETDRGRVYLQYGPPNNIIVRESSPTEYPYEIWQYDKIKKYSNKRFVFYNPDLVNNNHRLLHSDMIGELQNFSWEQQLSKRNLQDPNSGSNSHFGGNSRELFNQK